eukprot:2845502-Rhodomonas_salina.4
MHSTDVQPFAIWLRACYAKPGTNLPYYPSGVSIFFMSFIIIVAWTLLPVLYPVSPYRTSHRKRIGR